MFPLPIIVQPEMPDRLMAAHHEQGGGQRTAAREKKAKGVFAGVNHLCGAHVRYS